MKTIIIVSSLFFTMTICNGQDYSPTRFLWPANLSFNPYSYYSYDVQANELGINVAYDDAGTLKYVLLGVSGNILRQSTIATGYSTGWLRPAITSVRKGVREDVFIFWRHLDSIRVAMSIDGGNSWSLANSVRAKSSSASNILDAVSNGDSIHVTWDTGGNSYSQTKVHYALLNLSGFYPFWSDEYTSTLGNINGVNENGHFPKIVIVPKSNTVNIVYVTRKFEEERPYDRLVHRAKGVSDSAWDDVDVISRLDPEKETMYPPETIGQAHERQEILFLAASSMDSSIICSISRFNTQPVTGGLGYFKYSEAYSEFVNRVPDTTLIGSIIVGLGPNVPNSNGQSILVSDDSIYWTWKYDYSPNRLRVAISQTVDTLLTFSQSPFSMLSKNSFNKLLMIAQFDASMGGYRIPKNLVKDVSVNTYFTSKNRIEKSYDVSLNSGVTAVVYDTLALDSSSIFRVKGKLDVNGSGIVAVLSNSQLIVDANATLEIKPGGKVIVYRGGQLVVNSNGRINLQDGSIVFEDSSFAVISEPLGIRGHGSIVNSQITWKSTFQVDDTTHLIFWNGGTLTLKDTISYHNINISGDLMFAGSTKPYDLIMDSASIIYANLGGKFETWEGATIRGIPNIQGIYPSYIKSICTAQNPCDWQFKQKAPCDIYGTIEGRYTHYHGITENDTLREWQGIMVGYEDARIDLDNCTIEDIYVNNPSGSAIHLYEARNTQNKVSNSIIRREANAARGGGDPKLGDGVFMQPGYQISQITLDNNEIASHWWGGLTTVGSFAFLDSNRIFCNVRGVNAWDYSSSFLTNNCITNHIQEGLYCDLAEIRLHNMNTYGSNIISSNGGYQIRVLFEGYVEGGYPLGNGLAHGRDNKIVPLSPNDRRISAYYATAFNLFNWWDVVPDGCSGGKYGNFSSQQYSQLVDTSLYAVVIIDTALCDPQYITHSCDDHSSCYSGSIVARMDDAPIIRDNQSNAEPAFRKSLSINMKLIFVNFLKHVKKEQFNDAYQLVDQLFQLNAHEDVIASFSKLLLDHEIAYARAHPDSTEKCFTRIKSFMNQKHDLSNNNEVKAALLRMLAHTAFLFGDISLAQQKSIQLRNTYPASRFAKHNLWLEQLIAMAKRDTIGVDTTIARMTKAGYSSSELRVAERMKYGFLRVKQKELVSKRIVEQDESRIQKSVDELLSLTSIKNYPNPFNPSTIIEYYLPQSSHVTLKVYSILGKEIQTLVDDVLKKGNHAINFTASHNLQSGIFIYVLTTEWGNKISSMMYIK